MRPSSRASISGARPVLRALCAALATHTTPGRGSDPNSSVARSCSFARSNRPRRRAALRDRAVRPGRRAPSSPRSPGPGPARRRHSSARCARRRPAHAPGARRDARGDRASRRSRGQRAPGCRAVARPFGPGDRRANSEAGQSGLLHGSPSRARISSSRHPALTCLATSISPVRSGPRSGGSGPSA